METGPLLTVTRIRPGLWRWTAPHPEWTPEKDRPGGWGRMVGSVYCEPPEGVGAVVLIDPLAPPPDTPEAERFWAALDRDLERAGRPLALVIGNGYHGRGAAEFSRRYRARYGADLHVPADAVTRLRLEAARPYGRGGLPGTDLVAFPIEGMDGGETALYLRGHGALVFADAVIGAGEGRLAVAPPSWAGDGEAAAALYRSRYRASLEPLLELEADIVLPSHGKPVISGGGTALATALASPAWAESPAV